MYDSVAREIVTQGWADESFGSVQESGHFALLTIEPNEIVHLVTSLDLDLDGDEQRALAGYYIVREDSQGLVWITSFDTKAEAKRMYDLMEAANAKAWGSSD